jgi:small subunit ribosomal protein S18
MAGEGVVLQRHRVGHARRERRRVAHQGCTASSSPVASNSASTRPQSGEKRNVVEIVADELGPSLRWARAEVERTQRTGPDGTPLRQAARRRPPPVAAPVIPSTATKSRSEPHEKIEKDIQMTSKKNRARAPKRSTRSSRRRPSVLVTDKVDFVDYKDVNLLNRFVSDRSKIRNRRVTGNTVQQQRDIANAVKNAREMALLPYTKRVSQTRAGRPPRDRDEDGGGRRATTEVVAIRSAPTLLSPRPMSRSTTPSWTSTTPTPTPK